MCAQQDTSQLVLKSNRISQRGKQTERERTKEKEERVDRIGRGRTKKDNCFGIMRGDSLIHTHTHLTHTQRERK